MDCVGTWADPVEKDVSPQDKLLLLQDAFLSQNKLQERKFFLLSGTLSSHTFISFSWLYRSPLKLLGSGELGGKSPYQALGMVNIMYPLDWATGCSDIWPNVTLGESVRVFLGEIHTWLCRLRKADCPPQCGCVSSNQSKV